MITGILDFRYSLPTLVRQAFGTLSDDEHIQWDAERARHLEPDGDPAARQRQHDHIVPVCVSGQPLR